MGENNYLSAYKMINSQVVLNNQKLKEEIKDKIEMINELNEQLFKYREENKTLREMVQKLLEQFRTITTIMVSVRDQSESVFNVVYNEHAVKETEQQMRKPLAGLFYERRRMECPPHIDESAIPEAEDENRSMEDYRTAVSIVNEDEELPEELGNNFVPPKSPLLKRLERKSRNRSIDESFETIDTNQVVKVARKSQEYLHGRDSRESKHSDDENMNKSSVSEPMDISQIADLPQISLEEASSNKVEVLDQSSTIRNDSASDFPSDHSVQSELNPATDQSLRPAQIKRMASDSMLNTLIEHDANKENTSTNDTIANASCSTPLAKSRRFTRIKAQMLSPTSPVPLVSLKPLTKENLSRHNISFDLLHLKANKSLKQEDLDRSEQGSMESNDSRRPRRKAAPKVLMEPKINTKLRRT
ncbi:uncharacterized protein LOC131437846 [Malaya genurostris]|uniref:uncharacterized protein LOC131437846 n=1 Tax=Malaya genurostris TaxID=325434 RepID=UPI0026F3B13C|nr:uncharacterized protein LOC131437846 [Malaya genurostris]